MKVTGNIDKMRVEAGEPVQYFLPIGDQELPMNPFIGNKLHIEYSGTINCIACGRKTSKSFNQGYCFPCMRSLARCDTCIVRPELCHYDQGTCREPDWAEQNCLRPHVVYLANSSGIKVGITRGSQVPTRWIDQGASQALPILEVPDRHTAGMVEVVLKSCVADRTDWRKMLKGVPEQRDMIAEAREVFAQCESQVAQLEKQLGEKKLVQIDKPSVSFSYPVETYPEKINSLNLDKEPEINSVLIGIKGQYLIFESGVINIRKYAGYEISIEQI